MIFFLNSILNRIIDNVCPISKSKEGLALESGRHLLCVCACSLAQEGIED